MSNQQINISKKSLPTKIQVWIDFVCPYCLLGEKVVEEAIDGLDVEIEWMPYELRAFPTPTLRPEDSYLPTAWKSGVYPTAERMGVEIKLPTVSPQPYTRTAFLGLQYAASAGKADAYVDAVLKAFFQQDRDIGDVGVLKEIVVGLGLSEAELDKAIESPEGNVRHDQALAAARTIGIRAVPSVAVDGQVFSGVPSAQSLRAAILALKQPESPQSL